MYKLFILFIFFVLTVSNIFGQRAGNSILFDGTNDFVMVPHHTSLNPGTGSWSIVMWIKPVNEIRRSPLVTKRQPSGSFDQYSLGFANNDPHNPVPGKKIYYNYIDETGISERSGISVDDQQDTSWHHFAIVADKTNDSIFLYKDGIRQNYNIMYRYGSWPNIDNTESLFIGHNNMSHYYKGQMDEISLWKKALSPAQIISVKSDTLGMAYYTTPDSGLVGYWRFDEFENLNIGNPGTDDIRDLSFWGNHGDSEGDPVLLLSGIPIGIKIINEIIPSEYFLHQNYPNPFNPKTVISFQLAVNSFTLLKVYDLIGREVATLVNEQLQPGTYEVDFDGTNYPSGVYYYKINVMLSGVETYTVTKKMVFIK